MIELLYDQPRIIVCSQVRHAMMWILELNTELPGLREWCFVIIVVK